MGWITRTALGFLVALLAIIILSCGDDDGEPSGTTMPPESPTATLPHGDFPAGVTDFARTLDHAFTLGSIDLVKFTTFSDWDCPNNYFPAAGPNCTEVGEDGGVKAVVIGAYASEGDVYDAPSYGRFLYDWIYDAIRETDTIDPVGPVSDEFGDGVPRVYALADMSEEFEGEQGQLGTYEIIATKITPSTDPEPRREVLTFYLSGTTQGWLITHLMRSPVDFLDPTSAEASANFTAWQRWTELAPSGGLASRWIPERASRQVAYVGRSGGLYVMNADGSGWRTLSESPCAETAQGPAKESPTWSRDADRIAVLCGYEGTPGNRPFLEIYNVQEDAEPAVIENVATFVWSPYGHRVAYQTADIRGDPRAAIVRLRDLDTGEDLLVHDSAVLLDWPRSDDLILGLNPAWGSGVGYFESYEATWYNLASGPARHIDRFDDQNQFWISAVANKAVVLGGPAARKEGGAGLAVYNLETGEEAALPGLAIAYPSEGIPHGMLQVSPIDARFVWADFATGTTGFTVSEAALDGSQATILDTVPNLAASLASDGLVLYFDGVGGMVLRDTKTGAETAFPDAAAGSIAPVVAGRS